MIAYVAGHTHANTVRFYGGRRGRGFWEVNTASHIDWPQQSRLIELMDNRDGTLSIFGTILDSAAPAGAPAPGPSGAFTDTELASLGRTLSYNDPQRLQAEGAGAGAGQTRRAPRPERRAAGARPALGHNSDVVDRVSATLLGRWIR